jgi:putative SOS response-associated peptidase YedK
MCGRFSFESNPAQLKKRFNIRQEIPLYKPNYNITPGAMHPIIKFDQKPEVILAKWGLVPFWAKDPKIGYKMINARAETVIEKPSFRKSFISQRCLIPTNGFYEWYKNDTEKIPYFIHLKDTEIFGFAGLYDIWTDVEGHKIITFTIITTIPNALMSKIHERMPVIIPQNQEDNWINNENKNVVDLTNLLIPYSDQDMEMYHVSTLINNPQNNGQEMIKRID